MKKKKVIAKCLAAMMTCVLLASCGGSGGTQTPSGAQGGSAPASEAAAGTQAPMRIRSANSLASTDWERTTATPDMQIVWIAVFEGLYGMNEARGGYYNALAESLSLSDDQLTYTFTLADATFQNGDKFTADDVVYSYERAMSNPRFTYLTSMIDSFRAVDEKTFELKTKYPYSPIDHTLFSIKIVNKNEVEAQGDAFGTQPHKAGTGPYYISEYDPATGVKLTAYEGYRLGAADIKEVEYVVISEDSAAVIAYENGDIDLLFDAPTSEWTHIQDAAQGNSSMIMGNSIRMLTLNWETAGADGLLANEKIRKAIFYAVDKATVNQVATDGYGIVTAEYMPSSYVATSPKASDGGFETYEYDPEKSKALLLEAGFTQAQLDAGVNVGKLSTYSTEMGKVAQVIQANLEEVGLKIEIEVGDVSVVAPNLRKQAYDLSCYRDFGNFDFNNIRQQTHSESVDMFVVRFGGEGSPFAWQRMEELLDLATRTSDVAERVGYYTELWSIVMDSATILPLYHAPVGVAWSDRVDPGDYLSPTYYHIYEFSWK